MTNRMRVSRRALLGGAVATTAAAVVKAAGKSVTSLVGDGYNHFEFHETLGNPYALLGRAVLEQMKLRRNGA